MWVAGTDGKPNKNYWTPKNRQDAETARGKNSTAKRMSAGPEKKRHALRDAKQGESAVKEKCDQCLREHTVMVGQLVWRVDTGVATLKICSDACLELFMKKRLLTTRVDRVYQEMGVPPPQIIVP